MDLNDLRDDFRELSGRADLADTAVNRYISRGQDYLDREVLTRRAVGRHFGLVAVQDILLSFQSTCRVIQDVWVMNAANERSLLEKVDIVALRHCTTPRRTSGRCRTTSRP